eukprot:CAMPEP_0179111594 /NCGR_PEP_ID=MMETSP0796-20121207/52127_1 /TAXON_ID=73915 /ORGANISM="Pyrodinium bahamense, Strain pbaha01" /LENGTH=78 /DNA_ID=CAMNT_0020809743 /DNA_START=36 /DNA_END=272 /DNA_ORIENTATION=+
MWWGNTLAALTVCPTQLMGGDAAPSNQIWTAQPHASFACGLQAFPSANRSDGGHHLHSAHPPQYELRLRLALHLLAGV